MKEIVLEISLLFAALFLAVGLGGFLAGWTGWGGWIVGGALVWILFPPLQALVAGQIVVLGMDALLARFGSVRWDVIRQILPWSMPAVFLGALVAVLLPASLLALLAGIVLLLAVLPWPWHMAASKRPRKSLAILGGFWTTAGGWNAPPFALAVASLSPEERRGTLGMLFVILAALALPALLLAGIDGYSLGRGAVLGMLLLVPALLGTGFGLYTRHRASEKNLLRLGQALALLGAVALLIKAL